MQQRRHTLSMSAITRDHQLKAKREDQHQAAQDLPRPSRGHPAIDPRKGHPHEEDVIQGIRPKHQRSP